MESSASGKKVLVVLVVILAVLLGMAEIKRRALEKQLGEVTVQLTQQTPTSDPAAAQRIITQVGKLIALPEGIEPTVATIVDVETLRARNPFYNSAKNGDHLIVTPTRAILFDPERNIIVDVVPVQITPAAEQPAAPVTP